MLYANKSNFEKHSNLRFQGNWKSIQIFSTYPELEFWMRFNKHDTKGKRISGNNIEDIK